jgi:hypothetical protein
MERISYAAASVLTGDRLANAIVAYARALAKKGESDMVDFPVLLDSGEVVLAEILIGPASQLLSVPEHSGHDDIVDEERVADLERRTASLAPPRPVFEPLPEDDDDYPADY